MYVRAYIYIHVTAGGVGERVGWMVRVSMYPLYCRLGRKRWVLYILRMYVCKPYRSKRLFFSFLFLLKKFYFCKIYYQKGVFGKVVEGRRMKNKDCEREHFFYRGRPEDEEEGEKEEMEECVCVDDSGATLVPTWVYIHGEKHGNMLALEKESLSV